MERIPILKMGEFLLVTIQVDMHDRLALTLQDDLTERIVQHRRARRPHRHLGPRDGRLVHRPDDRQHRGDGARPRRRDGRGRHAPGGRHHPGRAGPVAAGRAHRAQRRAGMARLRELLDDREPRMVVQRAETVPAPHVRRRRAGAAGRAAAGRSSWASAWSTRRRSSRRPASSRATPSTYGGGGTARLEALQDGGRRGLRLIFEDKGPGIADIELALKDGFTSGTASGSASAARGGCRTSSRSSRGSARARA